MSFKSSYISAPDVSKPEQLQRAINTLQQNISDAFNEVNQNTVLDNVVIANVTINTSVTINHGLGREPTGYIIIKKSSNANVWNGTINSSTIALNSSVSTVITLLVF